MGFNSGFKGLTRFLNNRVLCAISDFCRQAYETWAFLGHHTAYNDNFLLPFRDNLTVRSWHLKMGPSSCPETSVRNYHCKLC